MSDYSNERSAILKNANSHENWSSGVLECWSVGKKMSILHDHIG
ncbi:hypothetical protein D1AOALGA4SA_5680 [Olavius algarvensis Delta 1 endosymbiont]|nr:hypothetical protein D1AOALGA4SA_5680 [Olavius algarvensis Delta 1 endosymbiont]